MMNNNNQIKSANHLISSILVSNLLILFGFLEGIFWLFNALNFVPVYRIMLWSQCINQGLMVLAPSQIIYGLFIAILLLFKKRLSKLKLRIGYALFFVGIIMAISIVGIILYASKMTKLPSKTSNGYKLPDIYSGRFTIEYPLDWNFDSYAFDGGGRHWSKISVKGEEGEIGILWENIKLAKFKSLCTGEHKLIKIKQQEFNACITPESSYNRFESGRFVTYKFEAWEFVIVKPNKYKYSIQVLVKSPYELNRPFVFKILETFQFTDVN